MVDEKPTVFISYSHKDKSWKDMLVSYLTVLELDERIALWDDTGVITNTAWFDEIRASMDEAQVAVTFISTASLGSRFFTEHEFPYLLERRIKNGLWFVPVLVDSCQWRSVNWIKHLHLFSYEGKSLIELDERVTLKKAMTALVDQIAEGIDARPTTPISVVPVNSASRADNFSGTAHRRAAPTPVRAYLDCLPMTGGAVFGRNDELNLLDDAWEDTDTNLVLIKAYGGLGKSALVNKWVEQSAASNFRGAKSVYAWSFYSQGAEDPDTSAGLFIDRALRWYGDENPESGAPRDKGGRLAKLVQKERSLLILDGLDLLQVHQGDARGKIRDTAVAMLLTELAKENPGLCLITTRESAADLHRFYDTVIEIELEPISPQAGRALLRALGIRGTDRVLEEVTESFGGHAQALKLLGAYLSELPGHSAETAAKIPDLDIPVEKGRHPRRIVAATEKQFHGRPEMDILRILGLFDRPADKMLIDALKAPPVIPGLTDHIQEISVSKWQDALKRLRSIGLVSAERRQGPEVIDAHPFVREHFGEAVEKTHPEAYREGRRRLRMFFAG